MQHFLQQYTLALTAYQTINLPGNVQVLDARLEYNVIALMVLVPAGRAERPRHFEIMATGESCDNDSEGKPLPPIDRKFIASIEDKRGREVWMLFELNRLPAEDNRKHLRRVNGRKPLAWVDEDEANDALADMVRSPFSDEQVAHLREHQRSTREPSRCSCQQVLRVEQRGYVCPDCGRVQTWAKPQNLVPVPARAAGPRASLT